MVKANSNPKHIKPAPKPGNFGQSLLNWPRLPKLYLIASLLILAATSIYWSILGAAVQLGNADALADAYLFKNYATFHGANFPGQHTMLLKWPLFLLLKLFGFSNGAFVSLTVLVVLVTVGGLVYLLARIERRKLVLGTLCLALAAILLLIPAQPYAGGLLPINMAMLTTRNLEYLVFIVSLVWLVKSPRLKSRLFWAATACLGLLIASDKLFLTIGLVAATGALAIYALFRLWDMVTLAVHWLLAIIIAGVGAICLLGLISASHLTHITSLTGAGPYGMSSFHGFVLGGLYAALGLLTNLGANPAYDATIVRNLPHTAIDRLFSLAGPSFIVNLAVVAAGIFIMISFSRQQLKRSPKKTKASQADRLAMLLIWTTLSAVVLFVISNHYYAVDARYLSIVLFAFFVSLTAFTRTHRWPAKRLLSLGLILTLAVVFGLMTTTRSYRSEQAALATVNNRNKTIAEVIENHLTDTLVGDYWRVLPIDQVAGAKLSITPLSNCSQPRADLSSSAWRPNLSSHSFTYLLSYDQRLTNYPSCSLKSILNKYGRPNASVIVAGTPTKPKEQLLFYDHGINKSAPKTPQVEKGPATVVPITPDQLPYHNCTDPSIMVIVAHQDDDLLFMNPDLLHAIKAGYCIRTVYMTAGDAGLNQFYWLARERGSEAAYSLMTGDKEIWVNRVVELNNHEFISVANPRGNSKISLIFLHLPDGNLRGQGFSSTHFESLAKLYNHQISVLHSGDSLSSYTYDQLVGALSSLMNTYVPAEIYTQSTFTGKQFPDHSDHNTVSRFVKLAYDQYESIHYNNLVTIPIHFYMGYPVHGLAPNISDGDLALKEAAFFAYAQYDSGVCHSFQICNQSPTYETYLTRQYQNAF